MDLYAPDLSNDQPYETVSIPVITQKKTPPCFCGLKRMCSLVVSVVSCKCSCREACVMEHYKSHVSILLEVRSGF